MSLLVGASLGLMNGFAGNRTDGNSVNVSTGNLAIESSLSQLREHNQEMGSIQPGQASYQSELEKLNQIDRDLSNLEKQLQDFQNIEPGVLVAPLKSQAAGLQDVSLRPVDFFAPAVLILLLQHLAVTFSALAIVREQRSGSMELFRISP